MPAVQKNFVVKNGLEVGRYGGEVIAALLESDGQPDPTYYAKVGIGTTLPQSTLEVGGDVKISSNLVIDGNLTVSGTETIINTNVLEVEDINVGIASASPTKLSDSELNGAGITIYGSEGDKTLLWDSSDSKMSFNTDVYFPKFKGDFIGSADALFPGTIGSSRINLNGTGTNYIIVGYEDSATTSLLSAEGKLYLGNIGDTGDVSATNITLDGTDGTADFASTIVVAPNNGRQVELANSPAGGVIYLREDDGTRNIELNGADGSATFAGDLKIGTYNAVTNLFNNNDETIQGVFIENEGAFVAARTNDSVLIVNQKGNTPAANLARFQGNGSDVITFNNDGSASFKGDVVVGGNANAGTASGVRAFASGAVKVSSTGSNAIWSGYTTGTSTETSVIRGDGSAEFAGDVDFGEWKVSNNSLDGARIYSAGAVQVNRTSEGGAVLVGRLNGSVTSQITADGSANFTSNISVLGDGTERGKLDLYCESTGNPHYSRLIAPAHGNFTGNVTVVMPNSDGTLLLEDGSGANLTNLNADNLSSGTIPDARFPAVLPAVDGSQLLGVISGVSISDEGGTPVDGITTIDFRGAGVSATVDVNAGIATVDVSGGGGGGGSGNSTIEINTSAPFNPSPGDLWYSPDHARTFIYYDESAVGYGTNSYWIDASPFEIGTIDLTGVVGDINASGSATFGGTVDAAGFTINGSPMTGSGSQTIVSDTAPNSASYNEGTLWWNSDSTDNSLYVLYQDSAGPNGDAGGKYWVEASPALDSIGFDGTHTGNSTFTGNMAVTGAGTFGGEVEVANKIHVNTGASGNVYLLTSEDAGERGRVYITSDGISGQIQPALHIGVPGQSDKIALDHDGSATFAGSVQTGDQIDIYRRTTDVSRYLLSAKSDVGSTQQIKFDVKADGSATFAGTVDAAGFIVNGNPVNGLQSRQVASVSETINANASSDISLTMAKTFALLTIESNGPCWITLYADETSRTADATRNRTSSPFPGSGVLTEVIFTSAGKQLITPGTIGFSPDEQTTYYLKVVNDGSTGSVNLDFTYVPLEA